MDSTPKVNKPSRALTVLLAEDIRANQKLLTSVLRSHSHEVIIANNGREAIDLVLAGGIDVVLMDVRMPVVDGYEATRAIRQAERASGQHVPIIAMTGNDTQLARQRGRAAGMDAHLAKPIDLRELVELIDGCANGQVRQPVTRNLPSTPRNLQRIERTINLDDALKRLHGDRELFREFVKVFDEDTPRLVQNLQDAMATSDAEEAGRAAHSLRGLAVNLGADTVQHLAAQLEDHWENADLAAATQAYEQLMEAYNHLHRSLEEFR